MLRERINDRMSFMRVPNEIKEQRGYPQDKTFGVAFFLVTSFWPRKKK
jgi:hypothetical protein